MKIQQLIDEQMKELERYTHYNRSIYSRDCSRGETEDEKSTVMLVKSDILLFLASYTRKLIKTVAEEIIGEDETYCVGQIADRFLEYSTFITCFQQNKLRAEQRLKLEEILSSLK